MSLQDLEKFRDTGELSDITVTVEDEELKLHKFPLYIKSEYFKENVGQGNRAEIDLPDFPGGKAIFALIADFCYNKRIDISLQNVAALRSGAEYLKMQGTGNLIELSDRYLQDVLNSAKVSRSISPLVDILSQCSDLGEPAENAKIAAKCFEAIMDIWIRPSGRYLSPHVRVDSVITEKLLHLPLNWFLQLIQACGENEHQRRPLAELASRYLERVFNREFQPSEPEKSDKDEQKIKQDQEEDKKEDAENDEETEEKHQEEAGSDAEADAKEKPAPEKKEPEEPKEPVGEVLDRVIMTLPVETPLSEVISAEWIRQALVISDKYGCECRTRLLQLAGNILHRFSKEELKEMPSSVLCEIIENTVKCEKVVPEVLSCVIDNHLLDLAKNNELTVEDFIKLAKSVPDDYRSNHDTLFEVAEQILTSGETIPDDKQKELLESIDLSKCHENTLQKALDKGIIPVKIVCQAAIDLSKKLRQTSDDRKDDSRTKYSSPLSFRRHEPNIRYQDPLTSSYSHTQLDGSPYSPYSSYSGTSYPSRYDDQSLSAFEDNLRFELSRISANYEQYFGDRGSSRDYPRSQFRPTSGKRW